MTYSTCQRIWLLDKSGNLTIACCLYKMKSIADYLKTANLAKKKPKGNG
jgi:hypothetical protein